MKKAIYLVAVATLAFFSCQKQETAKDEARKGFSFKASIEQLGTKATYDAGDLVWAPNDKIGLYVNDNTWTDKNQPFTLSGTDAVKSGDFVWDYGTFDNPNATAAFFPWEDLGSGYNNVFDGVAYFKLRDAYWDYSTGKMLTPLVAKVTRTGDAYDPIEFKHAGAAVKLTINNLVSGTYKVKMSVEGQQISGGFHVDPANAGTDALALDDAADITKNSVTLNTWKGNGAFDWIFPVPELATPKLSFNVKDNNGVTVWNVNLKNQPSDLNRGQMLVMPAQTITPYEKLTESTEWGFCGTINGLDAWEADIPLYTDGEVCVLSGVTFVAGDEFKIRKNKGWEEAYPAGGGSGTNWKFTTENAGAKDIIFNTTTKEIKVVNHTFPYPEADLSSIASSSVKIDGDMSDWTTLPSLTSNSTGTSRIRSWKFDSDDETLYFYFVLRKNRMSSGNAFILGFNWDDSGSYSKEDYSGLEALVEFYPFTNSSEGTPTCVDGIINAATINGTVITDAGIKAYGSDPNPSATDDSADYYLEISILKSKISGLPASGTIQAGVTYAWYETGLQDITL